MKQITVLTIIRSLFILFFCYKANNKLLVLPLFQLSISKIFFLKNIAVVVSIAIPACELLTVALLIIPATIRWGLYGSFLLMSGFTLVVGLMLLFSPHLPCSCGGVISKLNWPQHLLFNILFLLLAIIGLRIHKAGSKLKTCVR
jgi:putative oxidoreductase